MRCSSLFNRQGSGGDQRSVRAIPAARPLPPITSTILRLVLIPGTYDVTGASSLYMPLAAIGDSSRNGDDASTSESPGPATAACPGSTWRARDSPAHPSGRCQLRRQVRDEGAVRLGVRRERLPARVHRRAQMRAGVAFWPRVGAIIGAALSAFSTSRTSWQIRRVST